MADSQLYARTGDVLAADVAGEVVLLHTSNWNYFEFDAVGRRIWDLLETPRSLPSLVRALMDEFDIDEARCRSETKKFLDDLIGQDLVRLVDG